MCKHPYAAHWPRGPHHCPNLVPNDEDRQKLGDKLGDATSVPLTVNYPESPVHAPSLAHFWSDWYNQYIEADFPRLIIRYV